MQYALVFFSTVLLAFTFAVQKKYQAVEGAGTTAGLRYNALSGLIMAVLCFAFNGFALQFSAFSVIFAFSTALLCVCYSLIGFYILRFSGMAIYSIFLMIGGMLLPYIYGVLFLNEVLSPFRIIGVILIVVAVVFSNKAKYATKAWLYLLCTAVFILNGFVSILSKCHQINTTYAAVDSVTFAMYMGLGQFLFGSCALLLGKEKKKALALPSGTVWLMIAGSAVLSGTSYILQLIGAKGLPATVLYPMVTGGSIILSSLSGAVFFKEKLSVYQIASVVLCFVGTLLFLF